MNESDGLFALDSETDLLLEVELEYEGEVTDLEGVDECVADSSVESVIVKQTLGVIVTVSVASVVAVSETVSTSRLEGVRGTDADGGPLTLCIVDEPDFVSDVLSSEQLIDECERDGVSLAPIEMEELVDTLRLFVFCDVAEIVADTE